MGDKARSGKLKEQQLLDYLFGPLDGLIAWLSHIQPPKLPDTKGMSESQLYDVYSKYVESNGNDDAKKALKNGDQVIIALRMVTGTRENQGKGIYDDRIVVIWQDLKPAKKYAGEFKANTEPSAQYEERDSQFIASKAKGKKVKVIHEIFGPDGKKVAFRKNDGFDVDENGRLDLGRLMEGNYKFYNSGGTFQGAVYLRNKGNQTARRDTNHDGIFSSADAWKTPSGNLLVHSGDFAMYIHVGGSSNTFSAGCQTLPPAEHTQFFAMLKKKPKQTEYNYVLVEMNWSWDASKK